MAAHARLSPSGAHRWMACPGSVVLEAEYPDDSSAYAAEGTCAHDLAASVLTDPEFVIPVGETKTVDGYQIKVTQDMADYVMDYCKLVWEGAEGKTLLVEQRVPIGHLTGEEGATGTSDVIIIDYDLQAIEVIDLKYGAGVKVYAENNEQMQMYALGALHEHSIISDFSWVTMIIHQPRMNHVAEWHISTADLEAFADEATVAAHAVDLARERHGDATIDWAFSFLHPGEKQCRFCKAKATCPALREEVAAIAGPATAHDFAEFMPDAPNRETGDNYLSMAMAKVDMVEGWCKAVRAEVERRLLAGKAVDGFKLVTGKKGNRRWADEKAVEKLFKSFRLKQEEMFELSLISPTKAEKILTSARWTKVQQHIAQSDGKLSVAPATDPRPAKQSVASEEDFRDFV